MHPRTFALLIAGFVGGFIAACGPTTPACTSATCGGCCDSTGKCQSGASAETCGTNGATCGRCGTGTVCEAGECRVGGAGGGTGTGGGASTGGGTATGGSGGGGCRTVTTFPTLQTNLDTAEYRTFTNSPGHYNILSWTGPALTSNDGLRVEVVYPNDAFPSLPINRSFTAQKYQQCTVCAVLYEDCATTTNCAHEYLAQSGTVSITRADRDSAGRLAGSANGVRFNEWDIASDTAVPNGGCVIVTTIGPWDVGWNADGGAIP